MQFNISPWTPSILLGILLLSAIWSDVKSRVIPNSIVFLGAVIGIALHTALPMGSGLFNDPFGSLGISNSIAGLCVGLIILLPLYALGVMGAGDVKLLSMIGAFLGPQAIIKVALLSFIAGGLFGIIVALWKGVLQQVFKNIFNISMQLFMQTQLGERLHINAPAVTNVKLAYAIAISTGTVLYIYLSHQRFFNFI